MAIHIGHRQAGVARMFVAESCFILPAAFIVAVFACAYVRFGQLPETSRILYGIKPIIIGVVLQALWELGRAKRSS
jgi:chromate transporter